MISLQHIQKFYHQGKENQLQVLQQLNLQIEQGDLIAIVGQSGSGKTTLLNILGGLDADFEGTYLFGNQNVSQMTDKKQAQLRNQRIGFVLQDFGLIADRSVLENVCVPLYFSKTPYHKIHKIGRDVLNRLQIEDLQRRPVSQLSGGQKQRVAIARALVMSPDLLLADEPTGALDSTTTSDIMQVFEEINQSGTTIVIVTHNLDLATHCKKQYRLSDGVLKQQTNDYERDDT